MWQLSASFIHGESTSCLAVGNVEDRTVDVTGTVTERDVIAFVLYQQLDRISQLYSIIFSEQTI